MDFSKYLNFTTEDFLKDDAFIRYVLSPTEEDVLFWEAFQEAHPNYIPLFRAASQILETYRKQDTFYNEAGQDRTFARISQSIAAQPSIVKTGKLSGLIKIAAAVVLVVMAALSYWFFTGDTNQQTDFGQVSQVLLPDSSIVVLNGNSKITYSRNFKTGNREVWLTGEALFKVRHLNIDPNHIRAGEKFIVHCGDLNVEVLGTTFNVRKRRDQTSVGLLNGKIRVSYLDASNHQTRQLIMAPGEYLQHSVKLKPTLEKLEDPEKLILWVNHQINFNNATLQEIAQVLEDDFGYQVQLKDESMKKLRIEGEINVANVTDLLHIVSNTLHLNIKKEEKNIFIQP